MTLLEPGWKALLLERGIAVPAGVFVEYSGVELRLPDSVAELRPPLVLKGVSEAIVHKSEAGAVQLGLPNAAAAEAAARALVAELEGRIDGPIDGVLVEEMISGGVELLLGLHSDRAFGRLLVFGVGGIMVEAAGEALFFALPLRPFDVDTILATQPWVEGTLIRLGGDGLIALREAIWCMGGPDGIALDPRIEALEINPLLVGAHGAMAVDARGHMRADA